MLQRDWRLLNFDTVEAIPAALARARASAVARALATADWLLRRKSDGRFLAALRVDTRSVSLHPLAPANVWPLAGAARLLNAGICEVDVSLQHSARHRTAFAAFAGELRSNIHAVRDETLPLTSVRNHLAALGIPDSYGEAHALDLVAEPRSLAFAGFDRYRRPLFLRDAPAIAWQRMRAVAADDGIALQAISGYRSHAYQLGIFARKRARGQSIDDILRVNAAPGYSEHHGGAVLDIGTPGEPPAEESFESTPAFAWLQARAGDFGFVLSYPRGNPHGIVYEPWHWRFEARKCEAGK